MGRKSVWLGALLTIVFLALAFRGVELHELGSALTRADYSFVIPSLLATALGYAVRCRRWGTILAAEASLPFGRLAGVMLIGFASNNVLPMRLGEFIRAMLLQRHCGVRKSFGLGTIFLERVADGLTLLLILVGLTSLDLIPGVPGQFATLETITAAVFVGLTLFMALALAQQSLAERLVEFASRPLPRRLRLWLVSIFSGFLTGLATLRNPARLGNTALLSLLVWSLEAISYLALTYAFQLPLDAPTRVVLACTVLALVNLSIMIPSGPGYVGTFELAASFALGLFGIAPEIALAYAIVSHALQYLLVTAAGLLFFAREHVTLRTLLGQPEPALIAAARRPRRPDERSESSVQ